jgi:hypothetical protein
MSGSSGLQDTRLMIELYPRLLIELLIEGVHLKTNILSCPMFTPMPFRRRQIPQTRQRFHLLIGL